MDMFSQNTPPSTNAQTDSLAVQPIKAPTGIMAIPEIPERFQKKEPVIVWKPKIVKYIPTTEDSIQFNLLVKKQKNSTSPLYNHLAEDYLNPIQRNDRQWIKKQTTESIDVDSIIKQAHQKRFIEHQRSFVKNDSLNIIDSLQAVKDSTQLVAHTQQKHLPQNTYITGANKDIISGILIVLFAFIGYVRVRYYKYLRDLFSTIFNIQLIKKLTTAFSNQNQTPSMVLRALFLLNTSVFSYELLYFYNKPIIEQYNFWLIPICIAFLIVFFNVKNLLYQFTAYVFNSQDLTKEYITLSQHYSKIAGIIILPLAAALPYVEYDAVHLLLQIGIYVYLALYIIQILRSVTLIFNNVSSLYYMFLYLCALEILPLIVVYNILLQ